MAELFSWKGRWPVIPCYNCNMELWGVGEGLGGAPEPEGGVGEGELKFAAVFAEEKGEVPASDEAEVRREEFADGGERVMEPAGLGGEFLGPGVRRGEEEKAAREDQ